MMEYCDLKSGHCKPCEGGIAPLSSSEVTTLLKKLPGWASNATHTEISKTYTFKNYYQTMVFVNAIAFIAHQEDHHPDLSVHYNHCIVRYNTHAISGLSENDFICAAKVDALQMK